jgi:hypothetical protein
MADLTTTAKVKATLGRTDSGDDTQLGLLVTKASAWIENYCDRIFGTASYTEYLTGGGDDLLYPKHWPVTSITSVNYDTGKDWDTGTAVDSGDLFILSDTMIQALGYIFSQTALGAVKVVYVAGYATIPAEIEHAANVLTCQMFKQAKGERFGLTGQVLSAAAGAVKVDIIIDLPPDVKSILEKYRRQPL